MDEPPTDSQVYELRQPCPHCGGTRFRPYAEPPRHPRPALWTCVGCHAVLAIQWVPAEDAKPSENASADDTHPN